MPTDVEIPEIGESITEAVIVEWLKDDGAQVEADEPICVLETEKVNVDLPAPTSGILKRLKDVGDTIHVGQTIARIEESNGKPQAAEPKAPEQEAARPRPTQRQAVETETEEPQEAEARVAPDGGEEEPEVEEAPDLKRKAPPPSERVVSTKETQRELSPSVRRLIEEHGIDPSSIEGTGKTGRITKEDVMSFIKDQTRETPAPSPEAREERPATPLRPEPAVSSELVPGDDGVRRVPMSRIRRAIGDRLVAAQQSAAMLTTFNEIDMGAVWDLRAKHKERFAKAHGVSLGLTSFFARACVIALKQYPAVNARIDGDHIIYHDYVNLGIAVSTDRGLVVPVLRNAERMSFAAIEKEIKRMAESARQGKLALSELRAATFTISNGGIFGSLMSTPILTPPQSGILGMHAVHKRPVAVNDEIVIRPMMYVALTYDHRMIDGRDSVGFLVRLKELLEDPGRLMLEL